jgi:hypothetical protein
MSAISRESLRLAFEASLKGLFPDHSYELLPDGRYIHHALQMVFEGWRLGVQAVTTEPVTARDPADGDFVRVPAEPTVGMLAPFLLKDGWGMRQATTQYGELFDFLVKRSERRKFEAAATAELFGDTAILHFGPGQRYSQAASFAFLGWQVARAYHSPSVIHVEKGALKKCQAFSGFIGGAVFESFVRILQNQTPKMTARLEG